MLVPSPEREFRLESIMDPLNAAWGDQAKAVLGKGILDDSGRLLEEKRDSVGEKETVHGHYEEGSRGVAAPYYVGGDTGRENVG